MNEQLNSLNKEDESFSNYVFIKNKRGEIVVMDYESNSNFCHPEIGYIMDTYDWYEWCTEVSEYTEDGFSFDYDSVIDKPGIYQVYGYDVSIETDNGYSERYMVNKVENISHLYM